MSSSESKLLRLRPVSLLLLGLVLAGCASGAELDSLEPRGKSARDIQDLVAPVFIVAGVVLVLVVGAIIWISIRNRVPNHDDDVFPEQIHGHNGLEIAWTVIPAVILAIMAVLSVMTQLVLNDSEANAVEVEVQGSAHDWEPKVVVVGQQWWWEYRYYLTTDITSADLDDSKNLPPADIVTSTQMVIPTGEEIELLITSRDVIHSYWIPALNGKRDAVPQRISPWKLEADDPGVYFGQCTEFCGLSHSRMRMQVLAVTPSEFQDWIDEQMAPAALPTDEDSAEYRGLGVFEGFCSSCHLIDGVNDAGYAGAATVSGAAPNLTHFAGRTTFGGGIFNTYNPDGSINRDDLEAWIRDPSSVKDNFANDLPEGQLPRGMPTLGLSERQIDDVIAFLATLGPRPTDAQIQATEVE